MSPYIVDARINDGQLKLQNIPINNDTEVKVIVIPKVNLYQMSFQAVQELTKPIKGSLSDDLNSERAQ